MLTFLKHILQLAVNPVKGWEDISYDNDPPQRLIRNGYYPIITIAALSCFAGFFHIGEEYTFIALLQQAIITFTIFFATLYLAEMLFRMLFLPMSDKGYSPKRNTTFIVYCLSFMAIIDTILNILPVTLVILYFLPILVGVIIYKSIPYMGVKDDKIGNFMILSSLSLIAPIYVLHFIFNIIAQ